MQQEVAREVERLLQLVFADWRRSGRVDLEAVEMLVRDCMHRAGAAALERLLRPAPHAAQAACACGQTARYRDHRSKRLFTVVGKVEIKRAYYVCAACQAGQSPRDAELDVMGTDCSPGVRRMLALVGSDSSFEAGRQQLELLAGLAVTAKAVERHAEAIGADIAAREEAAMRRALQPDLPPLRVPAIPVLYIEMDGTGVPVVKAETEGRAGKREGQPAHTREVKLGCVFTQTAADSRGRPVRDEASTTYAGAIESADAFGRRLYAEAWRRGLDSAQTVAVLGDGAPWVWALASLHFPGAVQILDLYHARQHLWEVARLLFPGDDARQKRWMSRHQPALDGGRIHPLVRFLRSIATASPEVAEKIRTTAAYFEDNAARMDYPRFRRQTLFVGSGVIEAGCRTVVGARLKRSGMFWTLRGANSILALRCCRLSRRFEDYWADRSAAA